jgi:hypothetical protein
MVDGGGTPYAIQDVASCADSCRLCRGVGGGSRDSFGTDCADVSTAGSTGSGSPGGDDSSTCGASTDYAGSDHTGRHDTSSRDASRHGLRMDAWARRVQH